MALAERISNGLRTIADTIHNANPNRGAERSIAQPLPAVSFQPVNEPGSAQPRLNNAFYRLIDARSSDKGLLYLCSCGQSNAHHFNSMFRSLARELEKAHYCIAGCVSVIDVSRAVDGQPAITEQVRHVRKDEKGNPIPVGRPYSLLDLLPERGAKMSESERDKVYATLPTWRISNAQTQPGFMAIGDHGGNLPGQSADYVSYDGSDNRYRGKTDREIEDAAMGLMSGEPFSRG